MCEFEDNDSKGQDFENTFYTLMKHMLRIIAETQKMKNESRQHGRNCIHVYILVKMCSAFHSLKV